MKTAIQDMLLNQMQIIQKNYVFFITIHRSSFKEKKVEGQKNLVVVQVAKKYGIHIRALKQALNHRFVLKRVRRVIKFNQKAWLKPYIDMNTKLKKGAINEFEEDFFKLMNNSVFGKTMEKSRKHRNTKLVTTEKKEINQFQKQIIIQQNTLQKICWQQK